MTTFASPRPLAAIEPKPDSPGQGDPFGDGDSPPLHGVRVRYPGTGRAALVSVKEFERVCQGAHESPQSHP